MWIEDQSGFHKQSLDATVSLSNISGHIGSRQKLNFRQSGKILHIRHIVSFVFFLDSQPADMVLVELGHTVLHLWEWSVHRYLLWILGPSTLILFSTVSNLYWWTMKLKRSESPKSFGLAGFDLFFSFFFLSDLLPAASCVPFWIMLGTE